MTERSLNNRLIANWFPRRIVAYPLLLLLGMLLFLPNLGRFSLWDVDEAHNAECAREMWEAHEFIIPTFNYLLRTDKPVLLYWCIQACYSQFGVTEFAARFPSCLAGLLNLLLCYEIGRRLFDKWTGLLSSIILGSSFMFCVACHAVTPDALLILTIQAAFLTWIIAYDRRQPAWLLLTGICAGFALLAKGPVGVALPGASVILFLAWQRDWRFLWNRRTIQTCLLTCLVALPWYITVGVETHWEFIKGFLFTHNLNRFSAPMEGHQGPIYYHLFTILIAFAPWSIFLGPTLWLAARPTLNVNDKKPWAYRLLICWIIVWFVIFSLAATKLPNYVLPIYPPLALLTSRFLVQWAWQKVSVPKWVWSCSLICLLLIGLGLGSGLVTATGSISLPQLAGRAIPDLMYLLPLVLIPIVSVFVTWRCWSHQQLGAGIISLTFGSILLTAALAAWGPLLVDEERSIRPLAELVNQSAGNTDIRIGTHPHFYRPSLAFYTRREIIRCLTEDQTKELLQSPLTTFMLVPASDWPALASHLAGRYSIIDQHHDFTLGQEVLLICNQPPRQTKRTQRDTATSAISLQKPLLNPCADSK